MRNASPEEIQRAFAMPAPTPSSSPVPTLSPEQQEMLQAFSTQSGMNLEWSQKWVPSMDRTKRKQPKKISTKTSA